MSDATFNDVIQEDTMRDKYLTFIIASESYGIEIEYVTEIVGIQPITIVPELPVFVRGIINLRGQIIPVMDVRLKFKIDQMHYNDRTCIVVVDIETYTIGLIVDEVSDVLTIPSEHIVLPPKIGDSHKKYIKNIGKYNEKVILMIDCTKLLSVDEHIDLLTDLE